MSGLCAICGAGNAPFGLRRPGPRSALPAEKRGYLWHCGGDGCRGEAERRWERVGGRPARGGGASRPVEEPGTPAQPSLFGARAPAPAPRPDLWGR